MNDNSNRLFKKLASVQMIPLLILIVLLMMIGLRSLTQNMEGEIQLRLSGYANMLGSVLHDEYGGMPTYQSGRLFFGDEELTGVNSVVDKFKKNTGAEFTFFVGDVRALTTVTREDGERAIGTRLSDEVIYEEVSSGKSFFAKDFKIMGKRFYGMYSPYIVDGKVVGMVFAGESSESVRKGMLSVIRQMLIVFIITLMIAIVIVIFYSRNMTRQLREIKNYIGGLSKSKFDVEMSEAVLDREDEVGDLGRYAVDVGNVVRRLIATDPLTCLYNRRAGEAEFTALLAKESGTDRYIAAMLDIDFFKSLNDRFGHDYGDRVLVGVSDIMRQYVSEYGFVCRWGGEEFLMGMRCSEQEAVICFENILGDIRGIDQDEEGKPLITATIGAAIYDGRRELYDMVNRADECLYKGKNGGRNRIVTYRETEEHQVTEKEYT